MSLSFATCQYGSKYDNSNGASFPQYFFNDFRQIDSFFESGTCVLSVVTKTCAKHVSLLLGFLLVSQHLVLQWGAKWVSPTAVLPVCNGWSHWPLGAEDDVR